MLRLRWRNPHGALSATHVRHVPKVVRPHDGQVRRDRPRLAGVLLPILVLALGVLGLLAAPAWGQPAEPAYRAFPYVGSRLAIWIVAQIHLNFAAFILGVPIFAVIIEFMGWRNGPTPEGRRYDWLAHEFVKLTFAAFSTTALLGGGLLFLLITLYPKFWTYMSAIFAPTMWLYAVLFFLETFTVYLWYYGWDWLSGPRKGIHLALGILSNLLGTAILVVSNSWVTFMVSPPKEAIDPAGRFIGTLWQAVNNFTWMPINIHRLIANIVFGGTVAAAYAAFRFLGAKTDEERAQYDWMGYIGNFVAVSALMVLPFAGYWLGFEIYAFDQTMGITMMGGFMSWLWIVQAILIGVLFMGSNYYLWLGMERIPGSERYRPYIKYLLLVIALGFMVWATPHTLIASVDEVRRMGGTHHKALGVFGVMSAKNTAVNLMILTTFLSYLLYRRANKIATTSWVRSGMIAQWAVLGLAAAIVVGLGVGGYFVEPLKRIRQFSPLQVATVLATIAIVMAIDIPMFKGARATGAIRWGSIAPRSQYVLVLLAVTFTWLMGLMGFARSGIRQHWHIYGVMRDTSPDAATPALGYAANVITVTTALFLGMVMFIFWLGGLGSRGHEEALAAEPMTAGAPRAVPIAGGAEPRS
jgi:cytochrome d ubiquinol oxidase subunit I